MGEICASFDTSASRPAQDDVEFCSPTNYVILSRASQRRASKDAPMPSAVP